MLHDVSVSVRHPLITSAADYYKAFVAYIRSVNAPTLDVRGVKKAPSSTGGAPVAEPGVLSTLQAVISVPLAPPQSHAAVIAPEPSSELTGSWEVIVEPTEEDGAEVID